MKRRVQRIYLCTSFSPMIQQQLIHLQYDKSMHHGLQILMHYPYVLVIYFKGQMWNPRVKIKYPLHLNVLILHSNNDFKAQKRSTIKLEVLLQYISYKSLWYFDSCNGTAHKANFICENSIRWFIDSNKCKI